MNNYEWIFIYLPFVAFIGTQLKGRYKVQIGNEVEYRYTWFWAIALFLPLIYIAGTRTYVTDTSLYIELFKSYPNRLSQINSVIDENTKDKGFIVFSILIKQIFGNNYHTYLMIIAVISGFATLIPYKKYSCNYLLSVFLFFASTDFMSWMMNGMRQYLAASLLFLSMGLILNKKYIHLIFIILVLSTVHTSALLLIPVAFIVQGEAWNKRTVLFLMAIVVFIVGLNTFTNVLDTALSETHYNGVVKQFSEDDGTNPLRVLVYSVPTIISFIYRNKIKEKSNKVIDICINMSIISTGFYIVSMFTSGIYIGRIPIYFSLYNYILLPWEIETLFDKQNKRLVYFATVLSYLVFFYIQTNLTWG